MLGFPPFLHTRRRAARLKMIEEVDYDGGEFRVASFESLSRQVREGLDDQNRRWKTACNRVANATHKLERAQHGAPSPTQVGRRVVPQLLCWLFSERGDLFHKVIALQSDMRSEDQTLELLKMQQAAAASRNDDLAEKEQHDAAHERQERQTYVRQLFDRATAANERHRSLLAEADDPQVRELDAPAPAFAPSPRLKRNHSPQPT